MEEIKERNIESLLEAETDETNDSLLGFDDNDTHTDTVIVTDQQDRTISGTVDFNKEIELKKQEIAKRQELEKKLRNTPEFKASVVFQNYVKAAGRPMSGKEKRALKRECLRNAKKGKYDKLFDEEAIKKAEERRKAKFDKLNKPVVHSVDELTDEAKKRLIEMADEEPWHDSAPGEQPEKESVEEPKE